MCTSILRMGRKSRRNQRSVDDVIDVITQKSNELHEVQAELGNLRRMWPSNNDKPKQAPKALSGAIAALEKKCADIAKSFETCSSAVNDMRQYMQRQNLILGKLHNVPTDKYDYDFVVWICEQLNSILPPMKFGKIFPNDINDAHPLYNDDESRQPHVIVQFNKRWIRNAIYRIRKDVQQVTGVRITEHLTKHNRNMLSQARDIVGGYYAWTHKGDVYASIDDDTKVPIKTDADIADLRNRGCVPRSPARKVKVSSKKTPANTNPRNQKVTTRSYTPTHSQMNNHRSQVINAPLSQPNSYGYIDAGNFPRLNEVNAEEAPHFSGGMTSTFNNPRRGHGRGRGGSSRGSNNSHHQRGRGYGNGFM